jgi:hypothetical protein
MIAECACEEIRFNPPLEGGSKSDSRDQREDDFGEGYRSERRPSPKSSLTAFEKISTLPQGEAWFYSLFAIRHSLLGTEKKA